MCRMRAIIFFQCFLIFFMNSQFVFSAEAAPPARSSCPRANCLSEIDYKEAQVERSLDEAMTRNDNHAVFRYFLESSEQFKKHLPLMSVYISIFLAGVGAHIWLVSYTVNLDEVSAVQIALAVLPFFIIHAGSLTRIVFSFPPFYRSYKTKKKAEDYLAKNLGHETFRRIQKFESISTKALISLRGDQENEKTLDEILTDLEKEEEIQKKERRCCLRSQER